MNLKKLLKPFLLLAATLAIGSCSNDECNLEHLEKLQGLPSLQAGTFPEEDLTLKVGDQYNYSPKANSPLDIYYQWYQNGEDMSTDPYFTITANHPMRTKVILELSNDLGKVTLENKVIVPGADYSKGCLIINEGWYGHEAGSISYYDPEKNSLEHWCYKTQNYGSVLGVTTQSATLWNGKLYVCSKQNNQLVIMDPKTLYVEKSVGLLLPSGRQAYEFIGINDQYGVVTANGDFYRIDLKTFKAEVISTGNTYAGCGSGIVFGDKLLLNVKGQKLYVIETAKLLGDLSQYNWKNQFPFTTPLDVITSGGTRFVQGKDGNLYTIESNKGTNSLVKIKPDLSIEKKAIRTDYSPSDFGSYREASFCGTTDGIFYYIAGGMIYKATFENPAPETPLTDYQKEGYGSYGAGIRINPQTNEVFASYLTSDYQKNILVRFNGTTGAKLSEIAYEGYYFPATFIFN